MRDKIKKNGMVKKSKLKFIALADKIPAKKTKKILSSLEISGK